MLWHIENSNTYLLGSVHVTNINPLRLPAAVSRIFSQSARIAFETEMDVIPDLGVINLPSGVTLASLLPAATYGAVQRHASRLQIPMADLDGVYPALAGIKLVFGHISRLGYSVANGVDAAIWSAARQAGKEIVGLEAGNASLKVLAESPLIEQIQELDHLILGNELNIAEIEKIVSAWRFNDLALLASVAEEKRLSAPVTFSGLIDNRNRTWLPLIMKMAEQGIPCMVVVGGMHMPGDGGLLSLLREHGRGVRLCDLA